MGNVACPVSRAADEKAARSARKLSDVERRCRRSEVARGQIDVDVLEVRHAIVVGVDADDRPHRALGRRTPQEVFEAKVKAGPGAARPPVHYRVRYDQVDRLGKVTLRYDSKLHHIGLGVRHRGKSIVLFVADRAVPIVSEDGELLRQLVLDPSRDYQRQSA